MKIFGKSIVAALLITVIFETAGVWAATLDVCPSGCTYSMIQEAIDQAGMGDTVLVYDGNYQENINFKGKEITVQSENGPYVTIIDGGSSGSVVTFSSGESLNSILNGFTLTNGSASYGAGIYIDSSSPSISNCHIINNHAGKGGGIFCQNSSSSITNCTLSLNTAWGDAGGLACSSGSSLTITGCTISGNSATAKGGGICCENSTLNLTNCIINGNMAGQYGGGTYYSSSTTEITDCIITQNHTNWSGGGFYCTASFPTLRKCIITGNSAAMDGGGCYFWYGFSATMINCSVTGNTATGGAGIFVGFPVSMTNCTFGGNKALVEGGAIYNYGSTVEVVNSILWGDAPNEIFGSAIIAYSDIEGGWFGVNNISLDPEFEDPRPSWDAPTFSGNYHLKNSSPCLDTGTDNSVLYPDLPPDDIDGDVRPQGVANDIGADEYLTTNISFLIGGSVTGLASGNNVVLQNNADDDLIVSANGSFTFATPLDDESSYVVTVLTLPTTPNQICTVTNGSGTLAGADVTNVNVICSSEFPWIMFLPAIIGTIQ